VDENPKAKEKRMETAFDKAQRLQREHQRHKTMRLFARTFAMLATLGASEWIPTVRTWN
jgi:hypothetical protein